MLQPIRDVRAGLLIQFSGLSWWPWKGRWGGERDCDQEANRGQGWRYNLIFVGPEGRVSSALPPPGGLSSLEVGLETASRMLGVAVPTKKGESTEGGFMGWRQLPAAPSSGQPGQRRSLWHQCPAWLDGKRGAVSLGSPGCVVISCRLAGGEFGRAQRGFLCCRWS